MAFTLKQSAGGYQSSAPIAGGFSSGVSWPMDLSSEPVVSFEERDVFLSDVDGLRSQQGSFHQSEETAVEREFNERADRWEKETAIHSAPGAMYLHRDYMVTIAKGLERPEVYIPLILKRISVRGGDWFFALEQIAGDNPAVECEDFEDAMNAWQKWAKARGLVKEGDALLAT